MKYEHGKKSGNGYATRRELDSFRGEIQAHFDSLRTSVDATGQLVMQHIDHKLTAMPKLLEDVDRHETEISNAKNGIRLLGWLWGGLLAVGGALLGSKRG